MNTEVEKFAAYLIEWVVLKCDMEFNRQTEFNIIRMIVDCVELYNDGITNRAGSVTPAESEEYYDNCRDIEKNKSNQ